MIVTVTLHACVHKYIEYRDVDPASSVVRPVHSSLGAGGKGINVVRALARLGQPALAVAFAGGAEGAPLGRCLDEEGLRAKLVPNAALTRTSYCHFDSERGRFREYLEEGGDADESEAKTLVAAVEAELSDARLLALCGSSPGPVSDGIFSTLVGVAQSRGVPVVLDSYGEVARRALLAGPNWFRCNRQEFERTVGEPLERLPRWLRSQPALEGVVVSDGAGAIHCWTRERAWKVQPPEVRELNAVGSGDALTAGFLRGLLRDVELPEAVRSGAAAGAANAESLRVCEFPSPRHDELLAQVQVSEIRDRGP